MDLTAAEARVLGCLIERAATAPEAYPLTLNDLRLACNQTIHRDPIVAYDDRTVEDTLLALKSKGLARFVPPAKDERTTRYRHRADDRWRMGPGDLAVLAVLLLHGVQTVSEVRARARRLATFADPSDVDAVLDMLAARTPVPFAARLEPGDPAGAGVRGETRWVQVLTGRPPAIHEVSRPVTTPPAGPPPGPRVAEPAPAAPSYAELAARVSQLEQRLTDALDRPGQQLGRSGSPGGVAGDAAYRSSDWRVAPSAESPEDHRSGPDHDRTSAVSDVGDRISAIERRLARIEAELGALR